MFPGNSNSGTQASKFLITKAMINRSGRNDINFGAYLIITYKISNASNKAVKYQRYGDAPVPKTSSLM